MPTSIDKISVRLTKSDVRQIEELMEYFGETQSTIVKKALWDLHNKIFNEDKK